MPFRATALPALFLSALVLTTPAVGSTDTVIPIADAQRGMSVTVAGTVDRITDEDEFILKDASDSIRVYVGPNFVPANVGDQVTVQGFIDRDPIRELYARSMTLPDGQVVAFDRRYD